MDDMEEELAEVERLKQIAWKKMEEDAKGAKRVEQAAQSQFTTKLLESVNNLRVGVVAPNVTVNVTGALARSFAKVPSPSHISIEFKLGGSRKLGDSSNIYGSFSSRNGWI